MKNRKLLLIVSLVLAMTMSLGGTLAYLTDTDADVNVMTLGNVKIEQIELERIEQSEAKANDPENFQPYTQGQMLLPAVGTDENGNIPYAVDKDGNKVLQQLPYGGSMQLWDDDGKNVMDKLVFVKNNGNTNAYVRTLIAYEGTSVGGQGSLIHFVYNGNFWTENVIGEIDVDGVKYSLYEYIYTRDDGAGEGVLKPDQVTRPSLLQVYMDSTADNEDMEQFGNTYEILVVSQAVQATGFESAEVALDAAFGDVTTASHPWMDGKVGDQEPDQLPIPVMVANAAELAAALEQGGTVMLANDITVDETVVVPAGVTATLNLNGKTITGSADAATIENNGTVTITGGTVENTKTNGSAVIKNNGTMVLDDAAIVGAPIGETGYPAYAITGAGKLTVEDGTSITSDRGAIYMSNGADVTINGGNITVTDALGSRVLTAHVISAYGKDSKLTINGGNFTLNYEAAKNTGASVICPWGATIDVYGGNFTYAGEQGSQSGIFQNYMGAGSIVNVYGGTYNDTTVSKNKNLAEGYEAVDNGDGTWTVVAE